MTFEEITKNEEICALIEKGNKNLSVLGFTDHSKAHCGLVAARAGEILEQLGYDEHTKELAKIAGFMHDIGNSINRSKHAEYGALLANDLLKEMNVDLNDRLTIITAIGNHDESTAFPVNSIAAALILADKTDVRYTRVRNQDFASFDIHDRVNYSVKESEVTVEKDSHIELKLKIETKMCTVMDYFEIFLNRMILCRKAAEKLGVEFRLVINGQRLL